MLLRLVIPIVALSFVSACSPKSGSGSAQLSLTMPTVDQLKSKSVASQKITATNIDWAKACFMADVTGVGINDSAKTKCDVPNGIFAGSVGASVSASQTFDS